MAELPPEPSVGLMPRDAEAFGEGPSLSTGLGTRKPGRSRERLQVMGQKQSLRSEGWTGDLPRASADPRAAGKAGSVQKFSWPWNSRCPDNTL